MRVKMCLFELFLVILLVLPCMVEVFLGLLPMLLLFLHQLVDA